MKRFLTFLTFFSIFSTRADRSPIPQIGVPFPSEHSAQRNWKGGLLSGVIWFVKEVVLRKKSITDPAQWNKNEWRTFLHKKFPNTRDFIATIATYYEGYKHQGFRDQNFS